MDETSEKQARALVEIYEALSQLWNAVYQDNKLYERYNEWSEGGTHPITTEMITRSLPDHTRQGMIKGYNAVWNTSSVVYQAKQSLEG